MAETSRSRVTITLGRSGQVVKREGPVVESAYSDSHSTAGTKRSVRDRLGSGDVDGVHLNNKRQRGDGNKQYMTAANGVDDMRLRKDDLRFKLKRKNVFRRVQSDGQHNGVDLREKLSRAAWVSTPSIDTRQRISEPNYARERVPEPNYARERVPEPNYARERVPEPNYARERVPEPNYPRERVPELNYARQYIPVQKDVNMFGRLPSTRSADPLPHMDSLRDPYSPWTLDRLRRRSPDGGLGTSRDRSPQRNGEELRRRPLMRTNDDVGKVPYMSKDGLESTRPFGTSSYLSKPTAPVGSMKPVAPLLPPPHPPSRILQPNPYMVDEHLSVDSLLRSLGLEKYAICFKAEEVDMTSLRQMGDNDLKELGIPMGPRKKILLALLSRSKRRL